MKRLDFFIVCILLFYGISCQQKSQQQEETETEPVVSDEAKTDFEKVVPNFPSASEFAAIIHSTGAEFSPAILADPDMVSQYPDKEEKSAVLLGVYLYDLGYCVAFQMSSYTEEYFDAAHQLAVNLGAEKNFLEILMNRYEENINQNDSVKTYFKETYQEASESISEDPEKQEYLRTIFLTGFYIEGLYNMLKVLDEYPREGLTSEQVRLVLMPIARAVLNQKENLYNLSRMLDERVLKTDKLLFYQNSLAQLNETYAMLDVDNLIAENRGEELLTNQNLNLLIDQVENIRSQIVSTEILVQ